MRKSGSWTPVFDYLLALLGIFLILAITETPKSVPMRIDTLGVYAVTVSWRAGSNDDVDLWVQDPQGRIAWFRQQDAGLMHLESDDLGTAVSGTFDGVVVRDNGERTIIKGTIPGEYIVNLHMYTKQDPGATTCTVRLWELRGNDRIMIEKRIVLVRQGQETTAFRFTLNRAGDASRFNTLPKTFVGTP